MKKIKKIIIVTAALLLSACKADGKNEELSITENIICYATIDENHRFEKQGDITAQVREEDKNRITIAIDPSETFQTVLGFGGSFTDSAAYLINQKLDEKSRQELMVKLFDPEDGIGLSFIRNPMGASDFARTIYSYNDLPKGETDFSLEHFSIDHDREDIIPLVKEALALNPDLKIMASPWSPPAWMKTTGSMVGGALREDCYEVYGDYFIRFLEAYRAEGIEIYAISPQNEPLYVPAHYPGCDMPADKQADFINQSLGPKLAASDFDTKLICYDHNWDRPDYPETVLKKAGEYVDGVAWHVYGGEPAAQSKLVAQFPDIETYFTEASGGDWVPPFEAAFIGQMTDGVNVLNNYSRCVVLWNMALDEENGPTVPGFGESSCRGIVTVNQQTGALTYNLDYYSLAHFSKFIRPGFIRVGAESKGSVYATACLSPDGKQLVVVAVNTANGMKQLRFTVGDSCFDYDAPRKSAATFVIDVG